MCYEDHAPQNQYIASEFENTMLLNVEILRLTSIFQHITACEQHRDPI